MMPRKDYEKIVDRCLDNIHFDRIAIAMKALDWKWQNAEVSADHARESARKLLLSLYGQPSGTVIRMGGFEATINVARVELLFVLERGCEPDEMSSEEVMPTWIACNGGLDHVCGPGCDEPPAIPDLRTL